MKICSNICNKYRKFKSPKILHILKKKFDLSIVYSKCGQECKKIFKEKPNEILKILGLITNIDQYQKIYNNI